MGHELKTGEVGEVGEVSLSLSLSLILLSLFGALHTITLLLPACAWLLEKVTTGPPRCRERPWSLVYAIGTRGARTATRLHPLNDST